MILVCKFSNQSKMDGSLRYSHQSKQYKTDRSTMSPTIFSSLNWIFISSQFHDIFPKFLFEWRLSHFSCFSGSTPHILEEFDIHLFSLSEMYKNRFRKIAAPSKLYTIACNFSDKYHITTEIFQNENRKQNFGQKSSLKVRPFGVFSVVAAS